ncbi:MAG TPA: DUF2007 domain-containing protein [Pirellulaceae bacterium]
MKELFRERDITLVAYYQSIVEAEGIATHIRNQHLTGSGLTEIPIPEFFPALCVVDEEDAGRAMEILRRRIKESQEGADTEVACPACAEMNPGNFGTCWSCGAAIAAAADG